jgi:hypothetical protein
MSSMSIALSSGDFEAYAPSKWKSNVFNRERLEVKQRLLSIGRLLQGDLLGADGAMLALEASVEHPALLNHKQVEAQHLFFFRHEAARRQLDAILDRQKSIASMIDDPTPQRNHIFLAVTLKHQFLELSCKLHPDARIDRQNLERKCEDHFEKEKLIHLLRNLGDGFTVGIAPELQPVADFDERSLDELLNALSANDHGPLVPGAAARLLCAARSISRTDVIEAGSAIVDRMRDSLSALLPLYRFIAWSRDNDFVSMRETLQKEKQVKRQKGLAKNDEVRIIRGMFAGKSGVIQEVDAKGGIKVLVGKMAVKIDVADVNKV